MIATTIDPHHDRALTFQGYSVLLTNPDGAILEGLGLGLFDYDTRILSKYVLRVDGDRPRSDASAHVDNGDWIGHLTVARPGGDAVGPHLPQDALAIDLRRRVGNGMLELMVVRNDSMVDVDVTVDLEFDADFADIAEKYGTPSHLGTTTTGWDEHACALTFDYRVSHLDNHLHRAPYSRRPERFASAGLIPNDHVSGSTGSAWRVARGARIRIACRRDVARAIRSTRRGEGSRSGA